MIYVVAENYQAAVRYVRSLGQGHEGHGTTHRWRYVRGVGTLMGVGKAPDVRYADGAHRHAAYSAVRRHVNALAVAKGER